MTSDIYEKQFGKYKVGSIVGLERWQVDAALEWGLLPESDRPGGKWSAGSVKDMEEDKALVPAILDRCGSEKLVAVSGAPEYLSNNLKISVDGWQVKALHHLGDLPKTATTPQGTPRFAPQDLRKITSSHLGEIYAKVKSDNGQTLIPLNLYEAADLLGRLVRFEINFRYFYYILDSDLDPSPRIDFSASGKPVFCASRLLAHSVEVWKALFVTIDDWMNKSTWVTHLRNNLGMGSEDFNRLVMPTLHEHIGRGGRVPKVIANSVLSTDWGVGHGSDEFVDNEIDTDELLLDILVELRDVNERLSVLERTVASIDPT